MARPLKIFMRGKRITMLQELLRRMGYPMHDQAGQFGSSTRDAVKAYQRQLDFKATGMVNDELLSLMQQKPLAQTSKPEISEHDLDKPLSSINQHQLDALIQLLINKGVITEEELQAEISRPKAIRVTQKPLV